MLNQKQSDQIASVLVITRELRLSLTELLRSKFRVWAESVSLGELHAELISANANEVTGESATTRYGNELRLAFRKVFPSVPWWAFWRKTEAHKNAVSGLTRVLSEQLKTPFLPWDSYQIGKEDDLRKVIISALQDAQWHRERNTTMIRFCNALPWSEAWKTGIVQLNTLLRIENALQQALTTLPSQVPTMEFAKEHPGLDAVVLWTMPKIERKQLEKISRQRREYRQEGGQYFAPNTSSHGLYDPLYGPLSPWQQYYLHADDDLLMSVGALVVVDAVEASNQRSSSHSEFSACANSAAESNAVKNDCASDDQSRSQRVDSTIVTDASGDYHTSLGAIS